MAIETFLNSLKFGNPWRYSDKSLGVMVPILRIDGKDGVFEERSYITIEEAKDKGITFKDTGRIDRVIVESSLGMPIFIRSGTALKSAGTQPRAVESSIVIIPQIQKGGLSKQEIPVRCIYASKAIRTGEKFCVAGDVPLEVRSELLSRSGQGKTWSAVGNSTHRFMASRLSPSRISSERARILNTNFMVSTDNLVGMMEEVDKFTDDMNKILEKVPLFEDQVGAVFLDMKEVIGLELFDHPKSWEAIHKEVEKRLGESVSKEEDKSFFKPDYSQVKPLIFSFLKKLVESEKTEISHGVISTVTLKGDGVVGEATTINGKVIHIVGLKIDKKVDREDNIGDTIAQRNGRMRGMRAEI